MRQTKRIIAAWASPPGRCIAPLAIALLLSACSPEAYRWEYSTQDAISGQVLPLSPVSSLTSSSRPGRVVAASSLCPSATASLFKIAADGTRVTPALSTVPVKTDGSFEFDDVKAMGITVKNYNQLTGSFVVEVRGCNAVYARLLTATNGQNINWGSTLVAYVLGTEQKSAAANLSAKQLEQLYSGLGASADYSTAYDRLHTDPALANQFQRQFGATPEVLLDASPMLVQASVPTAVNEKETASFALAAQQWDSHYAEAYRWEIDGTVVSQAPSYSYTPSANNQGTHVVRVLWGQNDGHGDVDTLKPYSARSYTIEVNDAVPATAPPFTAVPALVNTPNLTLRLQTGAALAACESFSGLALTEDLPIAPANLGDYTITCAQGPTQDIAYTLVGGPGSHTIYLWAVDAAGNISATPRSTTVTYNNSVPFVEFTTPADPSVPTQSPLLLEGNCEASAGDVHISGDLLPSPTTASCPAGTFSINVNLSAGDGTKNLAAWQTNVFGTTGSANLTLTRDSTRPTVSLASPAPSFTNVASVPVTVTFSEPVTGFDSFDLLLTNATVTGFTGSGATYSFTLVSSGQGAVNVSIPADVAFDAAGNGNTGGTLSRTYDSLPPSVTLTSAVTISPTNQGAINITVAFSEAVTGFDSADLALTNATVAGFSGSGASYSFTLHPSAQGAFSVQVGAGAAADAAANASTASNAINLVYDSVAPTASLTTSAATPTNTAPFAYTLTFTEPVADFALTDLTIVNGTATGLTGGGDTYQFTVTPNAAGVVSVTAVANGAHDAAGNGNVASNTVAVLYDPDPPVILVTSPAEGFATNQSSLTFGGTCDGNQPISLGGGGLTSPSSIPCSAGSFSATINFTSGDGAKAITFSQTDLAGNSTTVTRTVTKDTSAPALAFTSTAVRDQVTNANTATFTGTCEASLPINVAGGVDTGTATCAGTTWTYTTATRSTDLTRTYTFTQTDAAGNATTITGTWRRDTQAPGLTRTSPPDNTAAQNFVTLTGACETGLTINISGPGLVAPLSPTCSGAAYSINLFFSAGDGLKTMTASQTDEAGNTTSIPLQFYRDNGPPALTQTLRASPYWTNTNSASFGGACETGLTISVSRDGTAEGTASCPSGTWTYTTATQTTEATRTYSFTQTDQAGNSTTISAQWVRRTTPPAFSFTSATSFTTNTSTVTFTGNCTPGFNIQVSNADTATFACGGGTWSYTVNSQSVDGTRTYAFRQADPAGNATNLTGTWTRDTNLPQLTLTSTSPFYSNGNNTTFTGGCSDGLAIEVTGAVTTTIACSSGTWSYPASQSVDGSYTYNFRQTNMIGNSQSVSAIWVHDTVAPAATAMSINSGAAVTNNSYVRVALQANDSRSNITKFCLKSTNTAPMAGDACWVPVNANPPGLTPALTLNLSNYSHLLGITPGNYSVYGWLQDAAGNVSTNAASAGVDQASILYEVIYPPVLDTVFATNTGSPAFPVPSPQLSVGSGGTIFIKWRATTTSSFGGSPIKLSFTTDDNSWSTIASVANGVNGGCTLHTSSADANTTGCYNWSAPTSGFIRLRIEAQDSGGRISAVSPPPLNTSSFKLVAGNSEAGVGSSTLASIYRFRSANFTDWTQPNTFAINSAGTAYINDSVLGVLSVDPSDGITRVLLPKTGVTSGDGAVNTATVRNVYGIALDYQERLLVWDNDRIRRVDFTTNTITRIIGGGGSIAASIADAKDLAFEGYIPMPENPDSEFNWRSQRVAMIPMPNGDLYFGSWLSPWIEAQYKFRRYQETSSTQITLVQPTGYGHSGGPGVDISKCSFHSVGFTFDPATSAIQRVSASVADHGDSATTACMPNGTKGAPRELHVYETALDPSWNTLPVQPANGEVANAWANYQRITGRNGKLYALRRTTGRIYEYRPGPNDWNPIVGTGTQGQCADNTPALSCNTDVQDAFVTATGQLFFLDRGRIRTLDSANRVVTLFGQGLSSGDGGDPVLARFANIWSIAVGTDKRVIVYDDGVIREVTGDRSSLARIAGNGLYGPPRAGQNALSTYMLPGISYYRGRLTLWPGTNDILYTIYDESIARYVIGRLNRSTGRWETLFGGGTTAYYDADGLPASQIALSMYADGVNQWGGGVQVKGVSDTGTVLIQSSAYPNTADTGNWRQSWFKTYKPGDSWRQSNLFGSSEVLTNYEEYCNDGVSVGSCRASIMYIGSQAQHDPVDNKWMVMSNGGDRASSNRIRTVREDDGSGTPRTMQTLVTLPRTPANFAYWRTGGHEYIYYCSFTGGLYRYDVTGGFDTQLNLPSTAMKCLTQSTLSLDKANSTLYFGFEKNGLHAVGSIDAI